MSSEVDTQASGAISRGSSGLGDVLLDVITARYRWGCRHQARQYVVNIKGR